MSLSQYAERSSPVRQASHAEKPAILRQVLRLILKGMMPLVKRLTVTDYWGSRVGTESEESREYRPNLRFTQRDRRLGNQRRLRPTQPQRGFTTRSGTWGAPLGGDPRLCCRTRPGVNRRIRRFGFFKFSTTTALFLTRKWVRMSPSRRTYRNRRLPPINLVVS